MRKFCCRFLSVLTWFSSSNNLSTAREGIVLLFLSLSHFWLDYSHALITRMDICRKKLLPRLCILISRFKMTFWDPNRFLNEFFFKGCIYVWWHVSTLDQKILFVWQKLACPVKRLTARPTLLELRNPSYKVPVLLVHTTSRSSKLWQGR